MGWETVVVIILGIIVVGGGISLPLILRKVANNLIDAGLKKIADEKKHYDELKEKEQKDIRIAETTEIVKQAIDPLNRKIDKLGKDVEILSSANQSSLRNDLMNMYNTCDKQGFKTPEQAQTYADTLDSYHKLKGDSFIDKTITPAFNKIPLKSNAPKRKRIIHRNVKLVEKK